MKTDRLTILLLFLGIALALVISCGKKEEGASKKQSQAEQKSLQETQKKIDPERMGSSKSEPIQYNLRNFRRYQLTSDPYGRSIKRTYSLPNGEAIVIFYSWEGGTNRCESAQATKDGQTLAKAVVIDIGGNEQEGYYQVVEETHYALDGSGKVIYRARSRFAISFSADKLDEQPIEGSKIYELFTQWGTIEPGGSPY
jgi:hypothetical protein